MRGDPIRELTAEAIMISASIIQDQRNEEHAEPWMHYVVQPKRVFDAIGGGPTHPGMWKSVKRALGMDGYVVLSMLRTPGRYGPLCDGCRRDKMDASWHPLLRMRHAGRASELTGPVNCTVCGRRTPGLFRMYGHDEGVDIFEW